MIELTNVSKTYRSGTIAVQALRNISLTIHSGEFVAIMGPSGSGKSTLLHVLGFLDKPDKGSYKLLGSEITQLKDSQLALLRNHVAGFVFQQFHLLRRNNALENTELPLIYAGKRKLLQKAQQRLKEMNLADRMTHRPNELSGGEQQRVAIARSLVNDPLIIFADEPTGNLDTKSEEEIMKILDGLNKEGKTIVMVTHEQEIARFAQRIILMRDGEIISDQTKDKKTAEKAPPKIALDEIIQGKHMAMGKIELIDHIRQAFHAIVANKLRSFLSMLGILIGVGAVIAMLALGQGAKEAIQQRLRTLGSNLLSIRGGSARVRGVAMEAGSVTRFTFADVEAVRALPLVKKAASSARGGGQLVYKDKNWSTSVEGVGYDYGQMRATLPEIGRWFNQEEIQTRQRVAILGLTVVEKLFGDENPLGATIKINRLYFNVIGILPQKGGGHWRDQDDIVVIPVTTAMYRVFGKDYIDSFYVEVVNEDSIDAAQEEIKRLLSKRHRVREDDEDSFQIRNMSEIQETIEETTQTMNMLLGSIAAISLIVGGIGIMNIMLVSVAERTREIGLRKAIGAQARDIMTQFLIESIVMTFAGGIIGVILGTATAAILSSTAGWTTKVTLSSVVLATTFSIAVGIGFGLWPAQKASRLDPVEALRYE
ncbi:MAG: ABC transporter permease [Candidatus Omnitrophica bacterium]|nr:ABC transporter permease [Candidatus Omnitrophota bacterium]